ncbi:MAG TPA: division plane positioning ATPase MipZ [Rhizomicrobium sp.]|jgi:chromosome partitioning protein|nr:division plane positioning ATPase MipZ [Rhizomicrobium sp.]
MAAHIIVFGNEKGGSGKSTAAMHVAVALARAGKKVAAIDLDTRQRSFSRQLENRAEWSAKTGVELATPQTFLIGRSAAKSLDEAAAEELQRLADVLAGAEARFDFIVIDTPGADTPLSRSGHAAANTLVTPMNDSFVDFDLLARIDPSTYEIKGPSLYSDFVWDCRKRRLMARKPALDWVVMRNRVATAQARNKQRVGLALEKLADRIGFRLAPGFGERVIFRELFPMGLTMLDLPQPSLGMSLTMSHVAARQEVRELLVTLNLPDVGKI